MVVQKMANTLTWLHLSDLHLCKARTGWDAQRVIKTLRQDLVSMRDEHGLQADLLFFTGDLVYGHLGEGDLSIGTQFKEAHKFLEQIRGIFNIPAERIFLVPGNHDVDRREITRPLTSYLDNLPDGDHSSHEINEMLRKADADWRSYMQRLHAYRRFLEEHYSHLLRDTERLIYAIKEEVNGIKLGIAGLNAAWSCAQDREKGKLWLGGEWQLSVLGEELEKTDVKIALLHHPLTWLVPQENPVLDAELEQQFNFFLHGHEHHNWVEQKNRHVRIAAGACYGDTSEETGYNLVHLNFEKNTGEIWLRRFDDMGRGWIPRVIHQRTDNNGRWRLDGLPGQKLKKGPSEEISPDPSPSEKASDANNEESSLQNNDFITPIGKDIKLETDVKKQNLLRKKFPYPGLRPFAPDENDIFFGREEHTAKLIEQLKPTHFAMIVGASGYGKSSLARTGLLAGLDEGFGTDICWCIADLYPGMDPFGKLADALLKDAVFSQAFVTSIAQSDTTREHLRNTLVRGSASLHEIIQNTPLPPQTKLLILVDQFEELFRYYRKNIREDRNAADQLAKFVEFLLASSNHADIYIVITMRSDFMGDCALFKELPETINDRGIFFIPRLTREQLQRAITEPARAGGGQIEPALLQALLNDMSDNPEQLPLLQHALMRMWDLALNEIKDTGLVTLGLEHYEQIGKLDDALSNHVDKAYNTLDVKQQEIAKSLFRNLTERGHERRDTRRPVQIKKIAAIAHVSCEQVIEVVEVFRKAGRNFLMPLNEKLTADSMIDISHESLIRCWQQLRKWTEQEAECAKIYQRLEEDACIWEREGEDLRRLWRAHQLENALEWKEKEMPTPDWAGRYGQHFDLAMKFLEESENERENEERAKRQRIEDASQRELDREKEKVEKNCIKNCLRCIVSLFSSNKGNGGNLDPKF